MLSLCCLDSLADRPSPSQELDSKLEKATAPIRKLEDELAQIRAEFVQQEKVASGELQSYNKSAERLESLKREITK